jgi:hypothetical protein
MSIQPRRPYIQVLSETLAKLEVARDKNAQMADLEQILRERLALLQVRQQRSDSLRNQFHSDTSRQL